MPRPTRTEPSSVTVEPPSGTEPCGSVASIGPVAPGVQVAPEDPAAQPMSATNTLLLLFGPVTSPTVALAIENMRVVLMVVIPLLHVGHPMPNPKFPVPSP